MNTPYSDAYMRYDTVTHRYVLTDRFVREVMNIDLEGLIDTASCLDISRERALFLERISATVYSYIYRACVHYYAKERELAMNRALRIHIMRAMEEQVRYVIFNGDLSLTSGISLSDGTSIDSERLRSSEIAPIARDILISVGIVSIGVPRLESEIEPRYEEGY